MTALNGAELRELFEQDREFIRTAAPETWKNWWDDHGISHADAKNYSVIAEKWAVDQAVDAEDATGLFAMAFMSGMRLAFLIADERLHETLRLCVSYSPGAIVDHYDGDESEQAEFVRAADAETLLRIAQSCVDSDVTWRTFRETIAVEVEEEMRRG